MNQTAWQSSKPYQKFNLVVRVRLLLFVSLLWTPNLFANSVTIVGVEGELAETIQGYLALDKPDCFASERALRRRLRGADELVQQALDAFGLFNAEFSIAHRQIEECWRGEVTVQPGEPMEIKQWKLDVVGPILSEQIITATQKELRLAEAKRFDPQIYESVKFNLLGRSRDIGYLDARLTTHKVSVDPSAGRADIDWVLDGGEQYKVGAVNVNTTQLSDELVRAFLDFAPGTPYANSRFIKSHQNLVESDYFKHVRIEPHVNERNAGAVPVDVSVTPTDRWSALTGVGFSTDTGIRGRIDVEGRYLNRHGHKAALRGLASPVKGSLNVNYRWPYGDPTHQWYSLEPGVAYVDTDTAKSTTTSLQFKRTQRVASRWNHVASVNLTFEDFEVGDQEGDSRLVLFTSHWTYSTGSQQSRPMRGTRFNAYVRGALRALGSDSDVMQAGLAAKQIVPFFYGTRFIVRGEVGWTWQNSFADLPPSLRFFAGGDNSVRGYDLDALGTLEDGEVIGGPKLLLGSLEWDMPVKENWALALFVDSGSAYKNKPNFSHSIGLGLRWFSPLGPIRLDLAHPLDNDRASIRLHISLGPDI